MIFTIRMRIRRNVRIKQPDLALPHGHISFLELHAPRQHTLDFRSGQRDARLILVEDMVFMKRGPIGSQYFFFRRDSHDVPGVLLTLSLDPVTSPLGQSLTSTVTNYALRAKAASSDRVLL